MQRTLRRMRRTCRLRPALDRDRGLFGEGEHVHTLSPSSAGDAITGEAGPFTVLAQAIGRLSGCPDQRQDGFWPSLYADAPGFIGPGPTIVSGSPTRRPRPKPSWKAGARETGSIAGSCCRVSLEGVQLASHAASLWGIEANYPGYGQQLPHGRRKRTLPRGHRCWPRDARATCQLMPTPLEGA